MALGLKYTIDFKDKLGASWGIQFYFPDWAGNVTALIPSETPLVLNKGKKGDSDKMIPIINGSATINILFLNRDIVNEFFVENFTIKTVITQSDNTGDIYTWTGFVLGEFCEYQLTPSGFNFQINASDGLGISDTINGDLLSYKLGSDPYVEILDLLRLKALWKTTQSEVSKLRVISSLLRLEKTRTFDDLGIYFGLWEDNDTGGFKDVKTIITQIASSFAARIFCEDGAYWFQRIADLSNPDLASYTEYDLGTGTTKTFSPFKVLGGASPDIQYVKDYANIVTKGAYKSIKNDIDYIFINLLKNADWADYASGEFTDWQTVGSDAWTLISQGGTGTLEDPYYCNFNGATSSTKMIYQKLNFDYSNKITISFKIDMSNCGTSAWQLYAGSGVTDLISATRVYKNGSWIDVGVNLPGDSSYNNQLIKPSGDNNILTFSEEIPIPGTISGPSSFNWYDTVFFGIIDPDGGSPTPSMKIFDVQISFKPLGRTGEIDTGTAKNNWTNNIDAKDMVLIDGSQYYGNSLYYHGDENNTWKSDDVPIATNQFQSISIASILLQNSFPAEQMDGSFKSNLLRFYHVIKRDLDGKYFLQMGDTYDVKECIHDLTLIEIKNLIINADDYDILKKYKPSGQDKPIRIFHD